MKTFVFEDETLPYSEEFDRDGYFYRLCVQWKDNLVEISIGNKGVILDYFDDSYFIHTNIIPETLFGHRDRLEPQHLRQIVKIIMANGGDGKRYHRNKLLKNDK